MRKNSLFVIGLLLVASVLSACGATPAALAQADSTQPAQPRTLNVTGTGKAYLVPDIVYVSIGVHTEGSDAAEAVSSNSVQSQKVADALKAANIATKDIQTTNFSIYPQQQFDDKGKVTGTIYVVDNTVYVTLRDPLKVGDVLNAAVKAGANSINSVQFDVSDKTKALSEARKAAVADAQAQAKDLAEAAGVTLGEVQTINIYGGGIPVPVFEGRGVGGAVMDASVPVSPGQLILSVDVNMVYIIK